MKNNKPLIALSLAASVALTSVVAVSAQELVNTPTGTIPSFILPPVVTAPVALPEAAPVAPPAPAPTFAPLAYTSRSVVNEISLVVGTFPELTQTAGNPDFPRLNNEFRNNAVNHLAVRNWASGSSVLMRSDFTVENHGRFAVVSQTIQSTVLQGSPTLSFVYIIDKATGLESTQAALDAYLAGTGDFAPVAEPLEEAYILEEGYELEDEEEVEEYEEAEEYEEVEEYEDADDEAEAAYEENGLFDVVDVDGVASVLLSPSSEELEELGVELQFEPTDGSNAASFVVDDVALLSFDLDATVVMLSGEQVEVETPVSFDETTQYLVIPLDILELLLDALADME